VTSSIGWGLGGKCIGRITGKRVGFGVLLGVLLGVGVCRGQLGSQDVLLVVNQNSPTSVCIADLYRQYYPGITDNQIVYLDDITDSSGNTSTCANEIITRDDFTSKIAEPIRSHMVEYSLVNSTKVIVTTAGLPYRIEDTTYADVVRPGGSSGYSSSVIGGITAASVESELSVLFQIDQNPSNPNPLQLENRVVNPYQGYRGSSISEFDRDILGNRDNLEWELPRYSSPTEQRPMMEGSRNGYGMKDRDFSAGDIYLTSRLDGPKAEGESAVYAVHDMLERSRLASNSSYGVNPAQAAVVFDDAPGAASDYNYNRIYNIDSGVDCIVYAPDTDQPPDTMWVEKRDDYYSGFEQMTGLEADWGAKNVATMADAYGLTVIGDMRESHRTNQADLAEGQGVIAVTGFGWNGDEGSSGEYILTGGPEGQALFDTTYGAIFTSIESFNAVTMFSDVAGHQGNIIDFIGIGGSGAIGHCFEPYSDAIVDNEFLFYNLLADADGDGFADMTFVEAAFSALPYLSWSEVVIGDPLMQIAYGPGGLACGEDWLIGDVNLDDYVTEEDLLLAAESLGGIFGDSSYNVCADVNRDGSVTYYDLWLASENLGAYRSGDGGAIPEPSIFSIFSLGSLLLWRKRGRTKQLGKS